MTPISQAVPPERRKTPEQIRAIVSSLFEEKAYIVGGLNTENSMVMAIAHDNSGIGTMSYDFSKSGSTTEEGMLRKAVLGEAIQSLLDVLGRADAHALLVRILDEYRAEITALHVKRLMEQQCQRPT